VHPRQNPGYAYVVIERLVATVRKVSDCQSVTVDTRTFVNLQYYHILRTRRDRVLRYLQLI